MRLCLILIVEVESVKSLLGLCVCNTCTSAERGTRRTKRDWAAASPFFAAAAALILASISLHKVVTLERVQREGSKKKEYDSVADEWVHQRVTESESDDDSVEALTVRTPLQ